jgi:hypothetical protein
LQLHVRIFLFENFFYSHIGVICCRVRFVFLKMPTNVVTTKWKLDYYKSLKINVTSLETCRFLQIHLYIGQRMRGKHVHSILYFIILPFFRLFKKRLIPYFCVIVLIAWCKQQIQVYYFKWSIDYNQNTYLLKV